MMLATRHGNVELRSEFGNSSDIPRPWSSSMSAAGLPVTESQAFGLPAVSNVIRSAAETIASLPFMVYQDGPVKERSPDSWQYGLLHDRPAEECDSFEFFYDLALSLEATQNTFLEKVKAGGRVVELYVLDPQRVSVRRDRATGEKRFDVWMSASGVERDLTSERILHIRGFSPRPGAAAGVSLLQIHRDPIGAALAMQGFEGDYFRNGGVPPFWFTGASNREQAKEMVDAHNAQHQGVGRQWRAGALWGSASITSIPMSMDDGMFVEAKKLSIEDVCRIWRWPRAFAELADEFQPTDRNARMADFLKLNLLPRLRRIERAFAADGDLFWGSGLFGEFLTASLERADFVTRVRGYKDARQGGWITGNEIRELENYPPLDGGNELLVTPTGSAPNVAPNPRSGGLPLHRDSNGHLLSDEHELAAFIGEG